MTQILEVYQELTAMHMKQLAAWLSTVEQRYDDGESTTSNLANYKKHPALDIWFFYYDDISQNMGTIGGAITTFFLGTYKPTGKPVINTEVMQLKELTDAELLVYDPPLPE